MNVERQQEKAPNFFPPLKNKGKAPNFFPPLKNKGKAPNFFPPPKSKGKAPNFWPPDDHPVKIKSVKTMDIVGPDGKTIGYALYCLQT